MTLKVKDLIARLSDLDPEMPVILQRDAEGNGYSPLYSTWPGAHYVAENTFSGYVYLASLSAEDRATGYSEEDLAPAGSDPVLAVVLQPTN